MKKFLKLKWLWLPFEPICFVGISIGHAWSSRGDQFNQFNSNSNVLFHFAHVDLQDFTIHTGRFNRPFMFGRKLNWIMFGNTKNLKVPPCFESLIDLILVMIIKLIMWIWINGREDIVSPLHTESIKNNFLSPISGTLIFRATGYPAGQYSRDNSMLNIYRSCFSPLC